MHFIPKAFGRLYHFPLLDVLRRYYSSFLFLHLDTWTKLDYNNFFRHLLLVCYVFLLTSTHFCYFCSLDGYQRWVPTSNLFLFLSFSPCIAFIFLLTTYCLFFRAYLLYYFVYVLLKITLFLQLFFLSHNCSSFFQIGHIGLFSYLL